MSMNRSWIFGGLGSPSCFDQMRRDVADDALDRAAARVDDDALRLGDGGVNAAHFADVNVAALVNVIGHIAISSACAASMRRGNAALVEHGHAIAIGVGKSLVGELFGVIQPDALAAGFVKPVGLGVLIRVRRNPSRASLLTGRRPATTGVIGNRTNFRDAHPDWISLPQLFKQNGYVTARAGKIFHGGIDDPKAWGSTSGGEAADEGGMQSAGIGHVAQQPKPPALAASAPPVAPPVAGESEGRKRAAYSDRIVILEGNGENHGDYHSADKTIENLRKYKDQPFFIACGFVKPHSPPTAPQRFFDLYDVDKITLPPDFAALPTVPPGFPSAAIRKHNADLFIGRSASEAEAKEVIRAYLAAISWVDWNIGRVLAELDKLGLRENTIVVFVADHGYQLGEKGKWSKAGSLFEMGTRVPLILSAPGLAGNGQACPRIVESLDLYPTLVELCGLPGQKEIEGASLTPLLKDVNAKWDKPAYSIWSEDGKTVHGAAVRTERWRYAEYGKDGVNGAMLLDPHDPDELKNFVGDEKNKAVVAELSALARKYTAAFDKA
jgi:iduronate 2-sulfatase